MTGTYPQQKSPAARLVIPIAITVVVLAVVAFGVTWAWRSFNGPTAASKADCTLAQQMIDQAQTVPSDPAAAKKFEADLRKQRYAQFQDDGVSTQVGRYISWQVVHVTGEDVAPKPAQFQEMKDEAHGHCDGSGVDLKIPDLAR